MNKLSNKFKIIFSILIIGIILPVFILCSFYRPTTLNKYIVSKMYNEPVNSYFKDQNFYNCIIDAYNKENNTSYTYDYNLNEEELSSIKKLECSNIDLENLTGLEKLNNLDNLVISNSNLKEIDLSSNINITNLDLSNNEITNIDISSNTLLKTLNLSNNKLLNIDLSNNINLESLNLNNNNFKTTQTIYINKTYNINHESFITLPNNSESKLFEINNINSDIITNQNENTILSNKAGEYNITLTYKTINDSSLYNVKYTLLVTELTSSKYIIDNENNKIYAPHNEIIDENIINNLNINYGIIEYSDNKIIVKYDDEILKEFTIDNLSISSDNSKVKVYDDFIYAIDEINNSDITSNYGLININDDMLEIKYEDKLIDSYPIAKLKTNYVLYNNNIFIGTNDIDLNNFITNCSINIENNTLKIEYNNILIDSYNIIGIKFNNYDVYNDVIVITDEISYDNFIANVVESGVTYKIYNEEDEAKDGVISSGMVINVYKDDYLLSSYALTNEYLNMDSLTINDNYILNIKDETKVKDFINNINTTGSIYLYKNNNKLLDDDIIGTGCIIKIELNNTSVEYILVVKGDVDGDGIITARDSSSVLKHSVGILELENEYFIAGNIDGDNIITARDASSILKYSVDIIESW